MTTVFLQYSNAITFIKVNLNLLVESRALFSVIANTSDILQTVHNVRVPKITNYLCKKILATTCSLEINRYYFTSSTHYLYVECAH